MVAISFKLKSSRKKSKKNKKIKATKPIYLGEDSITCQKEKVCIPDIKGNGVTTCKEAKAIIKLILRDLKRGWTYNHYGQKIKMTKDLAAKRISFLTKLAVFHGAPKKERECIKREVKKALKKLK